MKQLRGTVLKRFLRDYRRAHPISRELVLVLQSVAYPVNVGSLFRIADAVDVSKMFLCGATPLPPTPTIDKVSRHKHHPVNWYHEEDIENLLPVLRDEGYFICALEITDRVTPYFDQKYPQRVGIIVGNEDHGVTRAVLSQCDASVFVPMYGRGRSLNVHVAAAVVLYHILHSPLP